MKKLLALVAVVAIAAVGAVSAFGATKTVSWKLPVHSTVSIHKGGSVKWVWKDSLPHDVKGPGFHSSVSSSKGHAYTHKFGKKGKFTIICTIHGPSMKTVVKVS